MGNHEYSGIRVEQQKGSPAFYLTAGPAAQVLDWCDVPRAKGDYMAGYQRALDTSRARDLADYIRLSPSNIVPGAIIIAVDSDYLTIEADPSGLHRLSIREDTRSFEQKLAELWGSFTTRLDAEELASAGIDFTAGAPPVLQGPTVADAPDDSDGNSLASDLRETDFTASELDDSELDTEQTELDEESGDDAEDSAYPASYVAGLAQELTVAVTDWNEIPADRQLAIRSFIEGVSKPGLIIDGQHRVFGAKEVSEFDVVLPLVILPGLPTAEQVFQFYVLNSKARPLKRTELRRIVSTSLTNPEIDELYHRFRTAGIEAEEARWTLELNNDPRSAFRGRIDFGFGEGGTIIPENVADQVVRGFMKMPKSRYRQLTAPLGKEWADSDYRIERFFWFWGAIKTEYADAWAEAEARADRGLKTQLFQKVALLTLQSFILDNWVKVLPFQPVTAEPPLVSKERISELVTASLTYLPAEFFTTEWKMKQLDTAQGRRQLYKFMEDVSNNQGRIDRRSALYRNA